MIFISSVRRTLYHGEPDPVGLCITPIIISIIPVGLCITPIMIFISPIGLCITVSLILYGASLTDLYNSLLNWSFGLDVAGAALALTAAVLMIVNSCIIPWLHPRGIRSWSSGCGSRGGNPNTAYSYCALLFSGAFYSLSSSDSAHYHRKKEGIHRTFRARNRCVPTFRWGSHIHHFII